MYAGVRHQLDQFGLKRVEPRDILDVMDDYTLGGHGNFNKKLKGELEKLWRVKHKRLLCPYRAGSLSNKFNWYSY